MLGDNEIRTARRWRGLGIEPYDDSRLQAASIDVTLDSALRVLHPWGQEMLDPRKDNSTLFDHVRIGPEGYGLADGYFVLGSTVETFTIPTDLVGKLEGKSSLGRLGLIVHSTAGFLDPGFVGQVTLELSVSHRRGVRLYAGMPIAQIAFEDVRNVGRPYMGKYNGQRGPTVGRYHENWDSRTGAWK